jgi:hypothetical protein
MTRFKSLRATSVPMGFEVEEAKRKAGKLSRPVFFGDEGTFLRT